MQSTTTKNTTTRMSKHCSMFMGIVTLSSFLSNFAPTHAFMQSSLSRLAVTTPSPNTNSLQSRQSPSQLFGYIAADATEEEFDAKQGGVGLAQDNAIVIIGKVDKKGNAIATDMKRYTKLTESSDGGSGSGISVVCKGSGTELYQNPGLGTDKVITLAPFEAVSEAIMSGTAAADGATDGATKISIHFAGGDDLLVHEVLESTRSLVSSLELTSKCNSIEFRSMCHASFPVDKCSVVVLAIKGGSDAMENVYWHEGQWWALLEDHLNTDIE